MLMSRLYPIHNCNECPSSKWNIDAFLYCVYGDVAEKIGELWADCDNGPVRKVKFPDWCPLEEAEDETQ
jgi:hypothetical protein